MSKSKATMPHPPEYYINLRNTYTDKINTIFLLESPPASGNYFYNKEGSTNEILFRSLMEYLDINAVNKEQGLKEFCKRGYLLVDATYTPVNKITNKNQRNDIILQNFDNLIEDLKALKAAKHKTPIILIKKNIYSLFIERLPEHGFNVINGDVIIPFPHVFQLNNFRSKLNELKVHSNKKRNFS